MAAPRIVNLTYLFFNVNRAIDAGRDASVSEAHEALRQGKAMDFLDQYDEVDLSIFKNTDDSGWDWDEMNAMFERYATAIPSDLSVENDGLSYVAAEIVERIQAGPWIDDRGKVVDVQDLMIERDW